MLMMAPLVVLAIGMETCPLVPSRIEVICKVSGSYERLYVVAVTCVATQDIFNGTFPNSVIVSEEFRLTM